MTSHAGTTSEVSTSDISQKKPWYKILYVQVLIAILLGALFGWLEPAYATNDWIKALIYFEIVSTFALVIGLVVGNVVRPGAGFGGAMADAQAVAGYPRLRRASISSCTSFPIPLSVPLRAARSSRFCCFRFSSGFR